MTQMISTLVPATSKHGGIRPRLGAVTTGALRRSLCPLRASASSLGSGAVASGAVNMRSFIDQTDGAVSESSVSSSPLSKSSRETESECAPHSPPAVR